MEDCLRTTDITMNPGNKQQFFKCTNTEIILTTNQKNLCTQFGSIGFSNFRMLLSLYLLRLQLDDQRQYSSWERMTNFHDFKQNFLVELFKIKRHFLDIETNVGTRTIFCQAKTCTLVRLNDFKFFWLWHFCQIRNRLEIKKCCTCETQGDAEKLIGQLAVSNAGFLRRKLEVLDKSGLRGNIHAGNAV